MNKQILIDTLMIINTFYSKKFSNLKFKTDLKSIHNNIDIINQKNIRDFVNYNNVQSNITKSELIGFIMGIAQNNNIKIKKADYKKQYNFKTVKESVFINYSELVKYFNSQDIHYKYINDKLIYNINCIQYSTITFLIVNNSITEHQTSEKPIFNLINNLIEDSTNDFWIKSYYKDLLVHDRIANFIDPHLTKIICLNQYCSTQIMDDDCIDNYYNSGLFTINNSTVYKL